MFLGTALKRLSSLVFSFAIFYLCDRICSQQLPYCTFQGSCQCSCLPLLSCCCKIASMQMCILMQPIIGQIKCYTSLPCPRCNICCFCDLNALFTVYFVSYIRLIILHIDCILVFIFCLFFSLYHSLMNKVAQVMMMMNRLNGGFCLKAQ